MFGLFGAKRKAATQAAVDAIRPMIASVQHSGGLPAHFWIDPYILGFVQFSIAWHAKVATNGKISGADLGLTLADSFTALSNMNGPEIVRRAISLENDPDFNRGADDAAAIAFYALGRLKNEAEHPLVQRAASVVDREKTSGPVPDRRNRIVATMFMLSLFAEVQKQLDPSPSKPASPMTAENRRKAEERLQVIDDFGAYLESNPVGIDIYDTCHLPHPKETILEAICLEVIREPDNHRFEALKVAAFCLSQFQNGVGDQPLSALGVDLSALELPTMNADDLSELAKKVADNPSRGRFEAFNALVEKDRIDIAARVEAAEKLRKEIPEEKKREILG